MINSGFAQSALPSLAEYKQVSADGFSVLSVSIDNDSLLLKKDDGFYTSGIQIDVRKVRNAATSSVSYGWRIGQELYTASDIKLKPEQLSSSDHPYAGWLYGGVYKQAFDASGSGTYLGLDVGCLGPCAGGEWTQTNLHKVLDQPLPQAWNTQLKQEWGVVASGQWSPSRWVLASKADLSPRLKTRLGNIFTDASADLTLRVGQLNQLPEQAANYLYLRGEIKFIAYDATLQGGYFNNQDLGLHPKSSVGELELGYLWRSNSYGVSAAVLRRSSGIKEIPNTQGMQNFARLQFSATM